MYGPQRRMSADTPPFREAGEYQEPFGPEGCRVLASVTTPIILVRDN